MLLDEQEFQVEIASSLQQCRHSIVILSAFIKHNAFEWLKEQVENTDIKVVVVARWRLDDLIAKVSDLSVYKQCQELGWTFKVDERLHAKLFLIDSSVAFVGSSNLTGAGLGLTEKSNFELSTKTEVTDIDIDKVHKYIDSCRAMTDDLYNQMKSFVDSIDPPKGTPYKWPSSIKNLLEQKVDYLWVDELLFTSPNSNDDDDIRHDSSLLEVDRLDIDVDLLRAKFTELRIV
jgi:phosphatidylserine/phosphatidylglycerophosphate/cardiolipin synthase-like enzyme